MRSHIIGNEIIENVGKSQSCMFSKLPIICEQTVQRPNRTCRVDLDIGYYMVRRCATAHVRKIAQ